MAFEMLSFSNFAEMNFSSARAVEKQSQRWQVYDCRFGILAMRISKNDIFLQTIQTVLHIFFFQRVCFSEKVRFKIMRDRKIRAEEDF